MQKIEELVSAVKEGADPKKTELVESKIYKLLEKCAREEQLTDEEKQYVFLGLVNARRSFGNGTSAISYGCKLDFSKWLKRYLVKYYGQLSFEIYFAFDEQQIRKNQFTRAGVVEVIQA